MLTNHRACRTTIAVPHELQVYEVKKGKEVFEKPHQKARNYIHWPSATLAIVGGWMNAKEGIYLIHVT